MSWQPSITAGFILIASCIVCALIIEIRARLLNLPRYAECRQCSAGHAKQNHQKQHRIHRGISKFDA
jgi:hypothetical protein